MAERLLAIGDVHGCSLALRKLLEAIAPSSSDTVVTLGDYVDRGPDGRGVLDELTRLCDYCNLVPLLGNHEDMLLSNRPARSASNEHALSGTDDGERYDDRHFQFLEGCNLYHETESHFFVHANYNPRKALSEQDRFTLLWLPLRRPPGPHQSKKTAIVGHTAQRNGEILDHAHIKCIDTFCHGGGWLTALEVHTGQIWQADREGLLRHA